VRRAAVAGIALVLPFVLVANGVYVLLHDWFVRFEYGRAGFPDDPEGMPAGERERLALIGLRSILPWQRDGIDVLRDARLDDGGGAFQAHELSHMHDVRVLLAILLVLHAVAIVSIAVLAARRRTRPLLRRGVRAGAALTLAIGALVGVIMLLEPVWLLTGFHTIFFEGSSWRFADEDTLRRLYPDRFWSDTAVLLGVGAAAQAVLLLAWASWPAWSARRFRAAEAAEGPEREQHR
jgi:integral membrane protein (TIGR01906 family)